MGVAVCFDEVAALDVGLQVQVSDEGAGLGGFAIERGFAGWVGGGEGWEGGVDCGSHCGDVFWGFVYEAFVVSCKRIFRVRSERYK